MPGQMKLPAASIEKTLRQLIPLVKKGAAEVLNDTMGDVALHAVKYTLKANADKLRKKLKATGNRGVMLPSGRRSRSKKTSMQEFKASAYVYAAINYYRRHGKMAPWALGVMPKKIARTGAPLVGARMSAAARQFVNAKMSSIAYIAVGWIMAARFFGKQITTSVSGKGWAHHSTGQKATPGNLIAKISNFSRGADKAPKIRESLMNAFDDVNHNLLLYLRKKISAAATAKGLKTTP